MAGLQTISTTDSIFTETLEKHAVMDRNLQDAVVEKSDDDKQDAVAFGSVLSGLLPTAKLDESIVVTLEDNGQKIAVATEDDESLDIEGLNASVVVNPLIAQVKANTIDISKDVPSSDVRNDIGIEAQAVEVMQAVEGTAAKLEDAALSKSMVDAQQTKDATTSLDVQVDAESTVDITVSLSAGSSKEVVVSSELINQQELDKPVLAEALLKVWQDQETKQQQLAVNDQAVKTQTMPTEDEVVACIEEPPEFKGKQTAREIEVATKSEPITLPERELKPIKLLVPNDAMGESEVKQPIPEAKIATDEEQRQAKIKAKFDNKSSISLSANTVTTKDPFDAGMTDRLVSSKAPKIERLQLVQTMGGIQIVGLERSSNKAGTILPGGNVGQNGYNFADIYSGLNVDTQGWEQGLGHRILWMRNGGIDKVSIHIEPPELGPLSIQLRVFENKANVTFSSHNPEIKGILESATPKLQTMFNEQGLGLGQVQVNISSQQFSNNHRSGEQHQSNPTRSSVGLVEGSTAANTTTAARNYIRPMGLVDYYA